MARPGSWGPLLTLQLTGPICQTPLSHEKCRTQCLGVHVEWCGRYHTLFRKNWSSRCSACKTTDEQHEKRHREIAELIAKINKLKADECPAAEPSTPRTPLTARALNIVDGNGSESASRTTKKERKQLKKAAKAMERDKVVTSADILFVANALHPEGEQGDEDGGPEGAESAEDMEIRMNLNFNASVCNTKSARHDFIKKDRQVDIEDNKAEIERVLGAFEMNSKAAGREGKLVAELAAAIQNDLVHYQDELRTTAKLRMGFWRWANVRAYRELVENGKDWDDHSAIRQRGDSIEELHAASEVNVVAEESSDGEVSERSGSINSSVDAASASTSITVPPAKPTPCKTPKTLSIVIPPKEKQVTGDSGWQQVGKKPLKTPTTGKLTMVKNGGLHHLAQSPKGPYGALTEAWSGPVDEDGKRLL